MAERNKAFVAEHLAKMNIRLSYQVSTTVTKDGQVTVGVHGSRTSYFANMFPPGGWPIHIAATATPMGMVPLCVLNSGVAKGDQLEMKDNARITAGGCLVHANGDIKVSNTGMLAAALIQSAGLATGRVVPTAQQSAPTIDDPFAGMSVKTPPGLCVPLDMLFAIGFHTLAPGTHCGRYKVEKDTTLKLLPGEHFFKGKLELTKNAILQGNDVVLVFDKDSDFNFADQSSVDLTGRKSGTYAGFVIATTRENTRAFAISSDSARQLLGTIYIPSATLEVTGMGSKIADQSAWTVIVAKDIKMTGSPNLVINSNYAAAEVPVPTGVGPSSTGARLSY
ncbi:MAG: hypothetical protein Q8R82_21065 [Hyphomonadaceae bacterium]|nr:hypothetical protein [Hyphomonadaceae bacterium]